MSYDRATSPDLNLIVSQRNQLLPGLIKACLKFLQKRTSIVHRSGTAKLFQFLSNLDNPFCTEVQAHTFQGVGMKGQLGGILNGLPNLGNSSGSALQK